MTEIPQTRDLFFPLPPSRHHGTGWVLGSDLGALIIRLDAGPVVAVRDDGTVLVNSSLDQYVESLRLVGELRDHLQSEPDDDESIEVCERALTSLDGPAYRQGEYWALVIEQIRDGLF
ncbi:MAG: SUKH-4 family immunity protein [Actinomycetia bacterium]|nr:SUKH-4 family immunity protein [Actinomycetes bacterium]